jgi:hypothetical protein
MTLTHPEIYLRLRDPSPWQTPPRDLNPMRYFE